MNVHFQYILRSLIRPIYILAITPIIFIKNLLFYNKYRSYIRLDGAVVPLSRNKICIFCHYDKEGKIADYVVNYVKALDDLGFAIFFVSNSGFLKPHEVNHIIPFASKILLRSNAGYDFGAHYMGLQEIKQYTHHDLLLLANDSVYGPLGPLRKVIKLIMKNQADAVGITDSHAINYHLQSYFIILNRKAFNSNEFKLFWQTFKFTNNKTYVVYNYEIGLSQALSEAGCKLQALYDYNKVSSFYFSRKNNYKCLYISYSYDQSIVFWEELIELGCPFIKKKLIPKIINGKASYINIISKTGYNIKLIE